MAAELGRDEDSVRRWLATYQAGEPLVDAQRSGRPIVLTKAMREAVRTLLAETERSWTAPALAVWVREQFGVVMHPNWLSVRMHNAGIVWKRTARTLQHKRDPDAHAAATAQISAWKKSNRRRCRSCLLRPGRIRAHPTDRIHVGAVRHREAHPL